MALDQLWKKQLTLVTYGNEYLKQNMSFSFWRDHPIFDNFNLQFRDLTSQHLLAQHFQVWLEGLKAQGVTHLSLHNASILEDEKNPNINVELLPYPHFIVSHAPKVKTAWIGGKELAEWYLADNEFELPQAQTCTLRQETFWRFELNSKLIQRVQADFKQPNWDDIKLYTDNELFETHFAQDFTDPAYLHKPFTGLTQDNEESESDALAPKHSLIPSHYTADYAHEGLHRFEALSRFIEQKLKSPVDENGQLLSSEEFLNLRHFSQKTDDLMAKFITKVANHFSTARLTSASSPLAINQEMSTATSRKEMPYQPRPAKENKTNVFALIIITVIICLCAFYLGL